MSAPLHGRTSSHLVSVLLTLFAKGQSVHLFRWTSFQFILNVQPCLFGYFLHWWNEASSASQQSTMLTELQVLHQTTCPILPLPAQSTLSEPLLLEPPGVRLWATSGQSNTHRKHAWPDGKNANKALTWVTQWTKCHVIITPVPTIPPVSSIEPPEGHSCRSSPDLQNTCRLNQQTPACPQKVREGGKLVHCFTAWLKAVQLFGILKYTLKALTAAVFSLIPSFFNLSWRLLSKACLTLTTYKTYHPKLRPLDHLYVYLLMHFWRLMFIFVCTGYSIQSKLIMFLISYWTEIILYFWVTTSHPRCGVHYFFYSDCVVNS